MSDEDWTMKLKEDSQAYSEWLDTLEEQYAREYEMEQVLSHNSMEV